jgi:hypothetical protein
MSYNMEGAADKPHDADVVGDVYGTIEGQKF